ncbi:restriction endonuclease subunit S [Cycloclasticus pugetii]|uniref:restriction endonuclease subunit S n=1 Tax=Cycloclasticus pugetii TaxID=34068 RepID=UPI000915167A|nr:restriction endonuclease subunit S [Cycloclasticus pugetii]SHJ17047.1 type I restriction enzyme, S subunit [Cycloclasticus pugetii]
MIVENKVPEIRYKGYSENWSIEKFKNVTKINQGLQIEISSRYTQKVENSYFYITNEFLKEASDYKYYIVNPPVSVLCDVDDVLMTRTGNTGHVVTNISGAFHNNFFKIKFDKKKLDKNFLVHYLKWSKTQQTILRSAGSSTIPDLNHNDFYNIEIAYSKIEEQTAIGNTFQKLDSLINQHQQKHDKLSNIKKAMLEKMFPKQGETVPEIRFNGFNGEWVKKKLGEIGETFTGLAGKTKHDFGHGQARFVTYMNVFANAISNENLVESVEIDESQNEVVKGDVFFTTSSETPEEVGMSSIWMGEAKNVYLNSFCFGYRPKQKIDSVYLAYMLRASSFRKQVIFLAQGVSRYNISKTKVMDIKTYMPSLLEQEKIGSYFQKLDALINQHQQQITKLNNIKQACLSKMFV